MEMEICVINKNVEMEMDSIFSDRVLELLIQDYFSCERVEIKIIELLSKWEIWTPRATKMVKMTNS